MSKTEKEKQTTPVLPLASGTIVAGGVREIARLRKMYKEFDKEKDVRSILRVKALIAYYNGMSPSVIAQCYEINEKTLKNWVERFENEEPLDDLPRSGRPSKLPKEKQEELREMIAEQNQRVWVARHVHVWLTITLKVFYSVRYLPEFLRKLGLSFHKAVHTLIERDSPAQKVDSGDDFGIICRQNQTSLADFLSR
jgi:transposase